MGTESRYQWTDPNKGEFDLVGLAFFGSGLPIKAGLFFGLGGGVGVVVQLVYVT